MNLNNIIADGVNRLFTPTKELSHLFKRNNDGIFIYFAHKSKTNQFEHLVGQYIHVLSQDQPVMGDYVVELNPITITLVDDDNFYSIVSKYNSNLIKKIELSTDPELKLPEPSKDYIKSICKYK